MNLAMWFFRPQQQSWTKRKLLLISGRILLCQVCFWRKTLLPYNIPTFKIWRSEVEQCERKRPSPTLMDYSWISAAVVERFVTMNCTKYVSGLGLSISICRHWLMSDYFCTLVSHPLILERFLTISKGGMSEISISFMGVAPLLKLWNNILLWKFVEIIIISSMCD